jgi:hypothetical protein
MLSIGSQSISISRRLVNSDIGISHFFFSYIHHPPVQIYTQPRHKYMPVETEGQGGAAKKSRQYMDICTGQ